MNKILIITMIGFASGIVIFPIGLYIVNLFRNTNERRRIKRMIKKNQFLIPIDEKDFDTKAWTNQKYGNIDLEQGKKDLENLNLKIFKKVKEINREHSDFMNKVINYVNEARKQGLSDDKIKEVFKKKNYSNDLINNVFQSTREV